VDLAHGANFAWRQSQVFVDVTVAIIVDAIATLPLTRANQTVVVVAISAARAGLRRVSITVVIEYVILAVHLVADRIDSAGVRIRAVRIDHARLALLTTRRHAARAARGTEVVVHAVLASSGDAAVDRTINVVVAAIRTDHAVIAGVGSADLAAVRCRRLVDNLAVREHCRVVPNQTSVHTAVESRARTRIVAGQVLTAVRLALTFVVVAAAADGTSDKDRHDRRALESTQTSHGLPSLRQRAC
jgi:hypothetical protein